MGKVVCKSEEILDDFEFEESKNVNCVNKDKVSLNKQKVN